MLRNQASPLLLLALPWVLTTGCTNDSASEPNAGGGGAGGGSVSEACANIETLRPTCQALPERFDASTTLEKGCYLASTSPSLGAGVTLTLAPGVTLLFAADTELSVSEDRNLVAVGTAEDPICLTGDTPQRGSWKGVLLGRTDAADDTLEHVTIEYGGSTDSDAEAAGLKVVSDSRPARLTLRNVTVRESEGHGLYLVGSAELGAFEGNTLTANTLGPASVDSNVAGVLDATSSYVGNDVDAITVRAYRLQKNATWASLGVPFHLVGNLGVEVPWTVQAPNTLVLGAGAWISVSGDEAALSAIGSEAQPIVFTGEQPQRGYWESLRFDGTNHAANQLTYVTVEYGGSTASDFNGAGVKADADSHGVTLGLSHVTLRENQGFGLYLTGSAVTPVFGDNTFTANGLGPASVGSLAVQQLDITSTYTGNDVDRVRVRDGRVSEAVTWQDLGVPYELEANVNVDGVWTLAPGVTLWLPEDGWIHVGGDEAGFHAVGTPERPITISGLEKTSGYWHGLVFDTTLNAANALAHATVEYGGSLGGGGEQGMITAKADSHGVALTVQDSVIQHSAQYGIWLGGSAQYNADIATSNTFSDNAAGDVFEQP